jgi:cation diffusion facilitator CzcD-associated flavoprotein CzcO
MKESNFSVAVIGAGPVGLAAAAHLVLRGLRPVIFERGEGAGHAVKAWSHVRLFSPWSYNIDSASRALLEQTGWIAPVSDSLPTGHDLIKQYLEPLSNHPLIQPNLNLEAEVISIARKGSDKLRTAGRENSPLVIHWID